MREFSSQFLDNQPEIECINNSLILKPLEPSLIKFQEKCIAQILLQLLCKPVDCLGRSVSGSYVPPCTSDVDQMGWYQD